MINTLFFISLSFAISPIWTQNLIGVEVYKKKIWYCEPPPQPAHGSYTMVGEPHPTIPNAFKSLTLNYHCQYGLLIGSLYVQCKDGDWPRDITECNSFVGEIPSIRTTPRSVPNRCVVPANPEAGRFSVQGKPEAEVGDVFESFYLMITCDFRYDTNGTQSVFCVKGLWSGDLPSCHPTMNYANCELRKHPSIDYRCRNRKVPNFECRNGVSEGDMVDLHCKPGYEDKTLWRVVSMHCVGGEWDVLVECSPGNGISTCPMFKHPRVQYKCATRSIEVTNLRFYRDCNDLEPAGTKARIRCIRQGIPVEGASTAHFFCVDTHWVHVTSCLPSSKKNNEECGIPSGNHPLIFGGNIASRGELPWHAAIYTKTETPYLLICGGSLVSNTLVISAAHCFWDDVEKLLPASEYAVAVGNMYRAWNSSEDFGAQYSDVKEIIIPPLFRGNTANFQEDIAIVRVVPQFEYLKHVRPVCLDFDFDLEKKQLKPGNRGKVGGWGLTAGGGEYSQVMRTVGMPFIPEGDCMEKALPEFKAYITGDKICAGTNGTAVCKGDSGGGLVFGETNDGVTRYYLRGVVSTAPNSGEICDGSTLAAFTSVNKQHHFLRDYL